MTSGRLLGSARWAVVGAAVVACGADATTGHPGTTRDSRTAEANAADRDGPAAADTSGVGDTAPGGDAGGATPGCPEAAAGLRS